MSMKIRFKHNRKGIGEMLSGAPIQELTHAKGEAIADAVRAAGIKVDGEPGRVDLPVEVTTSGRGTRARTMVKLAHPAGAAVEAKHGILVANIDAAQDAG